MESGVPTALIRYRIIALVVSVGLVVLFGIGMPLNHLAGISAVSAVVGPLHGFLYMIFLVLTFDLARRLDWPYGRMILVMLAGTIPIVSFLAERRTTKMVRGQLAERADDEHAAV
ncbi:MAG: DUF3817 domain-containing protein [Actinocatenispora sp.]